MATAPEGSNINVTSLPAYRRGKQLDAAAARVGEAIGHALVPFIPVIESAKKTISAVASSQNKPSQPKGTLLQFPTERTRASQP